MTQTPISEPFFIIFIFSLIFGPLDYLLFFFDLIFIGNERDSEESRNVAERSS